MTFDKDGRMADRHDGADNGRSDAFTRAQQRFDAVFNKASSRRSRPEWCGTHTVLSVCLLAFLLLAVLTPMAPGGGVTIEAMLFAVCACLSAMLLLVLTRGNLRV